MPFLGRKIVPLIKPLTDIKPGETIYTIPHTGEQFRSKEEYEKRVNFYKDEVWTCQCTGHINMSHEDATKSEHEHYDLLKRKFPIYFEKPVLEIVHHSTEILDNLVDVAWTKLQQGYAVGEPVSLKIKAQGKTIEGTVVKVDTSPVDEQKPMVNGEASTGHCSSPSSDKENHLAKVNGTSEGAGSDQDSPKRWTPPKLLPYKYSIKLRDEDKIINGIPAQDLQRVNRTPSKDLVKLFIRAYAVRPGPNQTSPWAVIADMVQKYHIPNKLAGIFVNMTSPKQSTIPKKTEEAKKRKLLLNGGPAPKKHKTEDGQKQRTSTEGTQGAATTPGTDPNSPKKRGRPRIHPPKDPNSPKRPRGRPRKDGSLPGSPRKTPLKSPRKTPSNTPRKTPVKVTPMEVGSDSEESSSDEDVPLANIKDSQSSPGKNDGSPSKKTLADLKRELKKQQKNQEKKAKKEKTNDKSDKKVRQGDLQTQDGSAMPQHTGCEASHLRVEGKRQRRPSNKMKQMTLFEMKGGKVKTPQKGEKTPTKTKSPRKQPSPYKLPPLAAKLQKAMKNENKLVFYQLLAKCARELSEKQRVKLPPELKEIVQKKWESIEEKKKVASMTEEEREEYNRKKRNELRAKRQEMILEKNKRYEDTELDLAPQPEYKIVQTPEGVPNELFGDVAMVTEFISSYSGLLLTSDQAPVTTEALLNALVSGKEGLPYLARVMSILLQTLLQDGIAEDYKELGFHLSSVPVTGYMVGELVRLVLRKLDISDEQEDNKSINSDESLNIQEEEVSEQLIAQLETSEFTDLNIEEKLQVLVGLCLRLMGTYAVQDYMVEKQRCATELWKKKVAQLKLKNDLLKEEKAKNKGKRGRPKQNKDSPSKKDDKLTISSFYGNKADTEDSAAEDRDLLTTVKSRRLMAARATVEKQKRDKEEKVRRERAAEAQRIEKDKEQFEKQFVEGIALAKAVFRHSPIGTDRHHNRYWIFRNAKPALYIEKGWAPKEITYTLRENIDSSDDEIDLSTLAGKPKNAPVKDRKRGRPKKEDVSVDEKTFPHVGQNLWFFLDEEESITRLLDSLHPQGIRESGLKTELEKHMDNLLQSLNTKWVSHEAGVEGMLHDIIEAFRVELYEMEMKLRNGGLGGVDNFTDWEKKLKTTNSIKELGECLIETQTFVMEKFLKGAFAPKLTKSGVEEKVKVEEVKVTEVKIEENGEEVTEVKTEVKEDLPAHKKRIQVWQEGVESCPTAGRLHVLMGMLESCIKWEKSAENAKCKICRRKYEDDELILCDECNQAFHLYCMRPALLEVPAGDWYCPSCQPRTRRSTRKDMNYRKMDNGDTSDSDSMDSDEDGEGAQNEEECAVCGGDEGLINCSTCTSSFHMDCHDPPLRREPRSCWKCMQCVSGIRIKRQRSQRRAVQQRKRYEPSSEEETEDDGDETEEEEVRPARSSRAQRSMRRSGGRSADVSADVTEDDDDDETEQETEEDDDDKFEKEMKTIEDMVMRLMRHRHSWPFHEPVDADEVPDYYQIVKQPMDLQTMKQKVKENMYSSAQHFVDDVALMFDNAELYNKPGSEVGKCIEPFEKCFKDLKNRYLKEYQYRRDFANPKIFEDNGDNDSSTTSS